MAFDSGPAEKEIVRVGCKCSNLNGDFVVSSQGAAFEKSTGLLGSGRTRIHHYSFEDLKNIRIESTGIGGSLMGNVALSLDHYSAAMGNRTVRYQMQKVHAERVIHAIRQMTTFISTPAKLEDELLKMIKPVGEANLREIAEDRNIRNLVAIVRRTKVTDLWGEDAFATVKDTVSKLIADGKLDGIITDGEKYTSSVMITRKTVQYQVVIDFTTLFKQLENKGIVLQTLDCPSCNGKLEYPKDGSSLSCNFCGATIQAVDVFEKFKGLLT
ncbi:MAG: hypothetical protein ACW98Y_00375 [Candidatus Thorarchaeota archaeon]|jgi:hypothetical protein